MSARPFPGGENFRTLAAGTVRLHQLIAEDRNESDEADVVRDGLDKPWYALSREEQEAINRLSADLYSVSEPDDSPPVPMTAEARAGLNEGYDAVQSGEWSLALDLLRRWGKYLDAALLSYLRGSVWTAAGYPEVGAVFHEHASRLAPDSTDFEALVSDALGRPHAAAALD